MIRERYKGKYIIIFASVQALTMTQDKKLHVNKAELQLCASHSSLWQVFGKGSMTIYQLLV